LHLDFIPRSRFRVVAALVTLSALATAIFPLSGCGYRVVGRSNLLPPTIKTIAVPSFQNRTANYRIEERLTDAVVHEFLARTSYHIVPQPDAADAVLRGEVDTVANSAEVFLEDRATGNVLYHNDNFVFREPYEISTDIPSFFEEESPALDRLSRDFAQRLVADVLEQF
jgi:lipopolysaccharide assembly LptE-like protein